MPHSGQVDGASSPKGSQYSAHTIKFNNVVIINFIMNILMIGEYPPKIGGISTHIYYLKKELIKLNQNVFVLTYSKSLEDGVYYNKLPHRFRGFFFILFGLFKGIYIIRQNKIDIIHSHFATTPGLLGLILSLITRKKRILTVHGSDVNVFLRRKYIGKIVNFVISNHPLIIAVSPNLANKLENKSNNVIVSISNGVDSLRFFPEDIERQGIGFIGALVNEKNPKAFIKIITGLRKLGIMEPAYVLGQGYLKKELEEMSSGLDISYLGEIMDTENYLKKFKIFISTSRTEGFGLSILDSMSCATPVVSLMSPGSYFLLGDLGLVVENENQAISLIEKIFKDQSFTNDISKKILEKSKLFSWEKCALENIKIYNKVLLK